MAAVIVICCFLCRRKYYKMASVTELDTFLATPDRFVPPNAPSPLPPQELLPRRRSHADVKAMFPKQFEIQGFCPVSYVDGKKRYIYHSAVSVCSVLTPSNRFEISNERGEESEKSESLESWDLNSWLLNTAVSTVALYVHWVTRLWVSSTGMRVSTLVTLKWLLSTRASCTVLHLMRNWTNSWGTKQQHCFMSTRVNFTHWCWGSKLQPEGHDSSG